MQQKSMGVIESGLWFFVHFAVCVVMGIVVSVLCAMLIILFLGKAQGLAWLEWLWNDSYSLAKTLPLSKLLLRTLENSEDFLTHCDFLHIKQSMIPHQHYQMIKQIYVDVNIYATAVIIGLKVGLIKLSFLLQQSKLFLILAIVSLIDGLTQRAIRRASMGRESAWVYHYSKNGITFSLLFGVFVMLALPLSCYILQWVMLFFMILFAIFLFITSKTFKKYL